MRFTWIIFLFAFWGCSSSTTTSSSNAVSSSVIKEEDKIRSEELIPQHVKEFIKNNLPGWSIPDTSDYIKAWWSFYDRSQVPYFITTDFNDDKTSDYALILKNQSSIRLFILTASGGTFIPWMVDDFKEEFKKGEKDIQFGLAIEPPGQIDCLVNNKEQSLVLKSNGIALMVLEQKYQVYYWDSGKYKRFRVTSKSSEFTVKSTDL